MPVAIAAAYVLVLQSLLTSFAFAADKPAGRLDAFGNVICTHAGTAEQPSGDPQNHKPSCCAFGCTFSSLGYGAPPDAAVGLKTGFAETAATLPVAADHRHFSRPRSPANPRAPPRLA